MSKRNDISTILLIGAGAVNVGNSGELDFFCRNVSLTLRAMGYKTILVNPNPASAANEYDVADVVYIEALNIKRLTEIIKTEKPDAILPAFGANTSLTLCHELAKSGILDEFSIKLLGTPHYAIECSESMVKFKNIMDNLGILTHKFKNVQTVDDAYLAASELDYPVLIHPEFGLSGNEDSIAYNWGELNDVASESLGESTTGNILISKAYPNWYNYILEVMRDSQNNIIIVSTIENINPLGVHPGDAISVSPILTLDGKTLNLLENYAGKIAEAMQIVGFADIRFAQNPQTGEICVVSVSPTISCMTSVSALVSGIPTAEVCARLCAGESLGDIIFENKPLTEYRFEYDEVFVKLPVWPFDTYKTASHNLDVKMRATGYVAGVAREFGEALQKAVRSLQTDRYGLGLWEYSKKTRDQLLLKLVTPTSDTLFIIYEALKKDAEISQISELACIKEYFVEEIKELADTEKRLLRYKNKMPIEPVLLHAKKLGFSDKYIAQLLSIDENQIRSERCDIGIVKGWEAIGEHQRFSTYSHRDKRSVSDRQKIIVIGSGANKIGQGMEFDYSTVKAAFEIKKLGFEAILINSNPTASSVYQGIFDKVYFEPLTFEDIISVCEIEKPYAVITQFCGGNPYEIVASLENEGIKVLGYTSTAIKHSSDLKYFSDKIAELDILVPKSEISTDMEEAIAIAAQIGYPIMTRSVNDPKAKYETIYSSGVFLDYLETLDISDKNPVIIESFLEHSIECDADVLTDGCEIFIPGIIEHIESAGINSGDSACMIPAQNISQDSINKIYTASREIVKLLGVKGLLNLKFASDKNKVYLLGVSLGSSRTIPLESKIFDIDMVSYAVDIMVKNEKLPDIKCEQLRKCGVLEVVFPWRVFPECDPVLGRDMYSIGMVLGIGKTQGEAFLKAQEAAGMPLPDGGTVFISVNEFDKSELCEISRSFKNAGFNIIATKGSAKIIHDAGIEAEEVKKIYEGRPNILDRMINKQVQIVINTPTDNDSVTDNSSIRKACIKLSIAYMTTMAAAKAAANGLENNRK